MTTLDLYILALLQAGVSTPYLLRTRAGISIGASRPALERLAGRGLVKEAGPGPRGRREFKLTRAGHVELANINRYLDAAVKTPERDRDSALRLFCCAMTFGKNHIALQLLNKAADDYERRAADLSSQIRNLPVVGELATVYVAAIQHCDAARLRADAVGFRTLASSFAEFQPGTATTKRKARRTGK